VSIKTTEMLVKNGCEEVTQSAVGEPRLPETGMDSRVMAIRIFVIGCKSSREM
jgi:hypothetical protein